MCAARAVAKRRRLGPGGVRLGGPAISLLRHIAVPEDQMAGITAAERKLLPDLEVRARHVAPFAFFRASTLR